MDVFEFILHIDEHLQSLIQQLGSWSYILLFAVIFGETGLVVLPFLPGDSLLFVVGTLAGTGMLRLGLLLPLLVVATILGDNVNYWIGRSIGRRVFERKNARFIKPEHLHRTQEFYERHGGKTIVLARFVPIIRTFAPFVAGVGRMHYPLFLAYSVVGAVLWAAGLTLAGYFFGSIPLVKDHFEVALIVVVLLSLAPAAYEFARHRQERPKPAEHTSYGEVEKTFDDKHLND
jgi:membrane-associated protein